MPQSAKNLLQDLKNQTVILMVGTIEPRKGYDVAIAAFEKIWLRDQNSAPYLVIAGKPGWKTGRLQRRLRRHPAAGEKLIWLSDASDEVIEQLYRISTGVFVTSHGEGYGLPIVEAGFHGKPVLARNLPVFQELAQSGISFFSDDRPAPLADALVKWLGSIARRSPISSPSTPSTSWAEARDDLLLAIGVHATDQRAINAGNSRADQDGSR
jgi:glycosyltransferase involved in cell wall biosynthesis